MSLGCAACVLAPALPNLPGSRSLTRTSSSFLRILQLYPAGSPLCYSRLPLLSYMDMHMHMHMHMCMYM